MATMRLPDTVAGVGSRCTLVLADRVVECEIAQAHVNAALQNVNGDTTFVDTELLVRFRIVSQTVDTKKATAAKVAIDAAVRGDRGQRQIDLE